ncbi:MAG: GFA family protein [Parvularculales bacterium]
MNETGGCYCGAVRYKITGEPAMKIQCNCRECQHIAGGAHNFTMGIPESGFEYTQGTPKTFSRSDLENPVTREFCGECGTPLASLAPGVPGVVLLKIGSLDNPAVFEGPQAVIYTKDKQDFHVLPEGVPAFETFPG